MKTAKIKIISPVLFAAGEYLNGATLSAPAWVMRGEADVSAEKAAELERTGYVDIVSRGGVVEVWPSCCAGGPHDH